MNSSPTQDFTKKRAGPVITFRLYVADNTPNSATALSNLTALCLKYWPGRYQIEIIDVLKEPLLGLNDHIVVIPTLLKVSPPPMVKVIGDLRDEKKLLIAMWLEDEI